MNSEPFCDKSKLLYIETSCHKCHYMLPKKFDGGRAYRCHCGPCMAVCDNCIKVDTCDKTSKNWCPEFVFKYESIIGSER